MSCSCGSVGHAAVGPSRMADVPVRIMSSGAGGACAADDDYDYDEYYRDDDVPPRRRRGREEPDAIVRMRSVVPGYYYRPEDDDGVDSDGDHDFPRPSPLSFRTGPIDLTVQHPSAGGHVVLGRNGLGKTLLARALVSGGDRRYVRDGNEIGDCGEGALDYGSGSSSDSGSVEFMEGCVVSHVSFDSHRDLLDRRGADATVYRTIAGAGNLNKAAQFLVVRFGLYPFLHRDVSTLSTGEIRKVMIVRALSVRPNLLVLDNVFDGLDVPSREKLKDLVSRTLQGFRPDILVQGVSAKAAQHTQVVMATHRPEEIVPEVTTVSYVYRQRQRQREGHAGAATTFTARLRTEPRGDRTGEELVAVALRGREDDVDWRGEEPALDDSLSVTSAGSVTVADDSDAIERCLPSPDEIEEWWWRGRDRDIHSTANNIGIDSPSESGDGGVVVIRATNLSIHRGDATPVRDVNWTVRRGEHWLVAGRNGSGKSTLSRLLASGEEEEDNENEHAAQQRTTVTQTVTGTTTTVGGTLSVMGDSDGCRDKAHARGGGDGGGKNQHQRRRDGVGWVSTELHMELARCDASARHVLTRGGDTPGEITDAVAEWIGLGLHDDVDVEMDEDDPALARALARERAQALLSRPFSTLSQGEQRLVLIASAVASRPDVLVLDEPCHGLDLVNRGRVLGLIERLCRASGRTDMSLVYITHHLEEVIPAITHVLHLHNGEAVYRGTREEYRPNEIQED